jgi:hypothetical protein
MVQRCFPGSRASARLSAPRTGSFLGCRRGWPAAPDGSRVGVGLPGRNERARVRTPGRHRLDRAGPGRCAAGCGWQGGQRRWALRRARQHLGMVLGLRGPRPVRRQADSSRRRLGRSGVEQPGVREPRQPTGRGAGGRRIQSRPRRGRPIRYPRGTGLVGRQRSAPGRHQRAPAHRLDAAALTAAPGPVAQKSPDTPVHGIQPGTTLG